MIGTRPNIAYAVTKLVQFTANPSQEHLTSAKYICCYLAGTKDYSIVYDGKTAKGIAAYTLRLGFRPNHQMICDWLLL